MKLEPAVISAVAIALIKHKDELLEVLHEQNAFFIDQKSVIANLLSILTEEQLDHLKSTEAEHADVPLKFAEEENKSNDLQEELITHPKIMNSGTHVGQKLGQTSIYHYVFFDNTLKCWKCNFTNERFEDEIEAAKAADEYLDESGDEKRPRNRSEFDLESALNNIN